MTHLVTPDVLPARQRGGREVGRRTLQRRGVGIDEPVAVSLVDSGIAEVVRRSEKGIEHVGPGGGRRNRPGQRRAGGGMGRSHGGAVEVRIGLETESRGYGRIGGEKGLPVALADEKHRQDGAGISRNTEAHPDESIALIVEHHCCDCAGGLGICHLRGEGHAIAARDQRDLSGDTGREIRGAAAKSTEGEGTAEVLIGEKPPPPSDMLTTQFPPMAFFLLTTHWMAVINKSLLIPPPSLPQLSRILTE